MANISHYILFNRVVMAFTIGSFASVAALPSPNYQMQIGINDVTTGVRVGKLLEKTKKILKKKV